VSQNNVTLFRQLRLDFACTNNMHEMWHVKCRNPQLYNAHNSEFCGLSVQQLSIIVSVVGGCTVHCMSVFQFSILFQQHIPITTVIKTLTTKSNNNTQVSTQSCTVWNKFNWQRSRW